MKLGCCSWSYHRAMEAGEVTFEDWLTCCAHELKVGGVDIIAEHMPKRTKAYWLETKKRCTDLHLTIASLSPGNNFGQPSAKARQGEVATIKRWIETAAILGAPCVRIFSGWPPVGKAKALWDPMVTCIRQVAKTAGHAGITLVVEPHNHGGFLPDSDSTLRLIREVDSPWVRINLDTGNYSDTDLYGALEASLPWSPHVVAKVCGIQPDGESIEYDYGRIFRMLKDANYRGFVTLEYEGEEDERAAVPKVLERLRQHGATQGL